LELKLAQVRAQLKAMADADQRAKSSGAQAQYGKRVGDHTSDALEHTSRVAAAGSLEQLEREVIAALERLSSGSYGRCDECRQPIAPTRLEALPWATRCVACQERTERRGYSPKGAR
jgi:DnaK suppressor protein